MTPPNKNPNGDVEVESPVIRVLREYFNVQNQRRDCLELGLNSTLKQDSGDIEGAA